jgi:hypothetical protein
MKFSLYDIDQMLVEAIEAIEAEAEANEGVYSESWDAILEGLQMDRKTKLLDCARYIKSVEAMAEAVKAEKQALAKKQEALENKAERIKAWVTKSMLENNDSGIQDANTKLSWRKSEKCIVTDESKIDDKFFKIVRSPMVAEIKAAIKAGQTIAGAELQSNVSLQIK